MSSYDLIEGWVRRIKKEAEAKGVHEVEMIDSLETTIRRQLEIAYKAGQDDVRLPIKRALGCR